MAAGRLFSPDEVRSDHIAELLAAIERFDEQHDISVFRTAGIASLKRCWRIDTRQLQLLLYMSGLRADFEPPLSTSGRASFCSSRSPTPHPPQAD